MIAVGAKVPGLSPERRALEIYLDALLGDELAAPVPAAEPAPPPDASPQRPATVSPAIASARYCRFRVAGLALALPEAQLDAVLIGVGPAPVPGAPAWVRGVVLHRGSDVLVADTARLVFPPGQVPESVATPDDPAAILVLAGGRWALTVDSLDDVVAMGSAEVRWRSAGTRRRWLAGTAMQHGCAVLDGEQFLALLVAARQDPARLADFHGG